MVSHNRLRRIKNAYNLPIADRAAWILDSGAYDVVTRHGGFPDDAQTYVRAVRTYDMQIRNLAWASTQDYPCEPEALAKTGLTVPDHQVLSVQSYMDVTAWWQRLAPNRPSPFRPVVQGDTVEAYLRCWEMFGEQGVDLAAADLVGVGSICKLEKTDLPKVVDIVAALRERTQTQLHGFGVHADAVPLFDHVDSMSWSKAARVRRAKHPNCTAWHRVCNSCLIYAEEWHERVSERHTTHAA
ncbi:hypothetical protein CFP71_13500 [Amycolatopsis thailandensis]|uniref:DeoxyPurine in DNA protein A domain-containing protein n=2 Tax=Amycolatopsis thailandensis TaxID=589330 RepID=A0A229SBZ7_9PSEU|nr:hypothetical protein [Amycolatopsis thailandensis]OXM56436.1 hypothetical protein CFP71_13500 [Amycolatopsis thailandensis]